MGGVWVIFLYGFDPHTITTARLQSAVWEKIQRQK